MTPTRRRARPAAEAPGPAGGLTPVPAWPLGDLGGTGDRAAAPAAPVGRETEPVRRFFIVSVSEDATGGLHGLVETVRTGRKERFQGLETLGPVIGAMFERLRADAYQETTDP